MAALVKTVYVFHITIDIATGDCDDLAKHQFIQEILVMKDLEQHANILQLIGCVTLMDPVCLVMEYAVNGDLLSYLHSIRPDNPVRSTSMAALF